MAMVRSAVKKNRWKSQRKAAARLQKQADAVLAMEEDEEIHFNRPETVPDTPPVSRNNTPDPEDEDFIFRKKTLLSHFTFYAIFKN